jgi:peptide/nickel transport system permease protein
MRKFLIRRFFSSIIALIGVTIIVFVLSRQVGDPVALLVSDGGYGLSDEAWQAQRAKLNLDKPVPIQYLLWLGDVLQGDLGHDLSDGYPVTKKIQEKIPNTFRLAAVAWVVATFVGIPLGVLSAVKRGSIIDYLARSFAVLGITLPAFYVAIMGILIFAVKLGWVPVAGSGEGFAWKNYVLPVATLSWGAAAGYTRLTRSAMLEVLDSEFVRLARLKGVSNRMVIWKHALRNSLIVPFTVSALLLAGFITGTVIVEVVFAWPGLGRLAVEAVTNNNLNLVVGTTLMFGLIFIIVNFLVDIGYVFIDPRIRLQ